MLTVEWKTVFCCRAFSPFPPRGIFHFVARNIYNVFFQRAFGGCVSTVRRRHGIYMLEKGHSNGNVRRARAPLSAVDKI